MQSILDPGNLLRRIEGYCRDEGEAGRLPKASYPILRDGAARNVTAELLARKLLVSDSPRAPLRLGFPTEAFDRWFPSLYPAIGS